MGDQIKKQTKYLPELNYKHIWKTPFKKFEEAEITFNMTHFPENSHIVERPYNNNCPVPQRTSLEYVAGKNSEKNIIIVGHPHPITKEFVDPVELPLEKILNYRGRSSFLKKIIQNTVMKLFLPKYL